MCAFDVNFVKAIDLSVSGLRAERTSRSEMTSAGSQSPRPTTPLAGYTDKLDERFVGKQPSG